MQQVTTRQAGIRQPNIRHDTHPAPTPRPSARKAALCVAIGWALVPLGAGGAAQASEPGRLDPVQVTATRAELPASQALASVTVISREDISLSQAPDLVELLARQAGIDVARSGGPGQSSTLFLRGGNSNHALVLVDGIRVNTATQGAIDLAHLPLALVERIEIVRGPRAALWGSDAIGGVVQVFTRDPSRSFVEARAGSYQRRGFDAGLGLGGDGARLGVAVGVDRLQGFSATNERADFSFDPDPDGYRNRHLALRGQALVGAQTLTATALASDAVVDFDAGAFSPGATTDARNRVAGASLAGPLAGDWRHSLVLGHASEDLDTPVFVSRFGSRRDSLDWVLDRALSGRQSLAVGANWSRESGYSEEFGEGFDRDRSNAALFARWHGRFGGHVVEASARHDDNSQFGGASTGNLAWGWQARPGLRLRASWGQGFRAPNFNELYYPGFDVGDGVVLFAGNPALQPERSHTTELGLDWQPGANQRLGLSAYRTRVRDLIAFEGAAFDAVNLRRAAVDGIEMDYRLDAGAWSLSGNATWQHARDLDTGARLLRRADRKANLGLTRRFGDGASWGLDWSAASPRPEFDGHVLAGYSRLDLRLAAPLAAGWWLDLRLENLGDRDYELVRGYRTPGRSGMIGLRWNDR